MRRLGAIMILIFWASLGWAQQEDGGGFLDGLLEDSLAGAGRDVRVEGFAGVLTSRATIQRITIADDAGIWLTMTGILLDWDRGALLSSQLVVRELSAETLEITRLPNTEGGDEVSAEAPGFSLPELPVSVDIGTAAISEISLGPSILGEAVTLSLSANATLSSDAGSLTFEANRTDGKLGRFEIDGAYEKASEVLKLDLTAEEDASGIAARLLNLPGQPAIRLTAQGEGPLDDFGARIELATDGVTRLGGNVRLLEDETGTRSFDADIRGDVTALFAPEYRRFFGDDVGLIAAGRRTADGTIDLEKLSLTASALSFQGKAALAPSGWPTFLDVQGSIEDQSGLPVLLPLAGDETFVNRARLSLSYDEAKSDIWRGAFRFENLDRADVTIDRAALDISGKIAGDLQALNQITAKVTGLVVGLKLTDPALARAVGDQVNFFTEVAYATDQPIEFKGLKLSGADYGLSADAVIDGLATGLSMQLDAGLEAQSLSRFSDLAATPLGGSAALNLKGQVSPLAGTFDLAVTGTGTDLKVGQPEADALLRGTTTLDIAAARDMEGLEISSAKVVNNELDLSLSGSLGGQGGRAEFQAKLRDIAKVAPGFRGPVAIGGTAVQDGEDWSVDVKGTGPYRTAFQVAGLATGPNARLTYQASIADVGAVVADINGPLRADGSAQRRATGWAVQTNLSGLRGTQAKLQGTVSDAGLLDLSLVGTAPLALSEPFIKPRSLVGDARFTLRVDGKPTVSAISGQITTTNGRLSAPNLRVALSDIDATATLSSGRAAIDLKGALSSGGRVTAQGLVTLSGGYPADLSVTLDSIKLTDPELYQTSADGKIQVNGPLKGGARISGAIEIGETEITIPSADIVVLGEIPTVLHVGEPRAVRASRSRAGLVVTDTNGQGQTGIGPEYPLDITVNAASRIFVRGRGLDVELGGAVGLRGTTRNIISAGQFELIRGRIDLLERRFQFDEGVIQLQGSFDPYIRLVARTQTTAGSASIIVEGSLSSPQVRFESIPEAPEDEVLAQLFFGRDASQLSAFQALKLANAVATLSGRGGEGVISKLRKSFGLDDLDVTTSNSGETSLRAGKYISDNIYTDVTVGSEGNSEVSLNLDLSPSVTARGSLGSEGDSSIGLFFERDY